MSKDSARTTSPSFITSTSTLPPPTSTAPTRPLVMSRTEPIARRTRWASSAPLITRTSIPVASRIRSRCRSASEASRNALVATARMCSTWCWSIIPRKARKASSARSPATSPIRPVRKTCDPSRTGVRTFSSKRGSWSSPTSTIRQRIALVPTSIAATRVKASLLRNRAGAGPPLPRARGRPWLPGSRGRRPRPASAARPSARRCSSRESTS